MPIAASGTSPPAPSQTTARHCARGPLCGTRISRRFDGRYDGGTRRDWLKSKCRGRQEFVICGHAAPKGSLEGFGAVFLASFEGWKLIPRGKVGTGFSDPERIRLGGFFKSLTTESPAWHGAESGVTWLRPELVAEIEFAEFTTAGAIRHGSYIGLREDKSAFEVHLGAFPALGAARKNMKVAGIIISNPDRVIYGAEGITKMELVRYYERVADYMLPHLVNGPLALVRAPSGIGGDIFFQKWLHHPRSATTAGQMGRDRSAADP